MPRPTLIEFTTAGDQRLCLIFQSKTDPLPIEEVHGNEVWPNRCPDDGTLFLEGGPEDYVDSIICLNPPDDNLLFTLSTDMVQIARSAETCSFGDTRDADDGGTGPGFTYSGGTFQHDSSLGVSNESGISLEAIGTPSGIVVLIDRPPKRVIRKYYDENDPSVSAPTHGGPQIPEDRKAGAADVDMDGQAEATSGLGDDLAGRMKTLRLKGR